MAAAAGFHEEEEEFSFEPPEGPLEQLLAEIDAGWRRLAAAVRGLSEAELMQPGAVGEWSVKDVIAHVTAWEQEGARRIDAILHGEGASLHWHDSREEEDAFNAASVARSAASPVSAVVQSLEDAHRDFVGLIAAFGDELTRPEVSIRAEEWLPGWTYLHYQEHVPQILEFRERRAKGGG
jgi:hypothetical protein